MYAWCDKKLGTGSGHNYEALTVANLLIMGSLFKTHS